MIATARAVDNDLLCSFDRRGRPLRAGNLVRIHRPGPHWIPRRSVHHRLAVVLERPGAPTPSGRGPGLVMLRVLGPMGFIAPFPFDQLTLARQGSRGGPSSAEGGAPPNASRPRP